MRLSRISMIVTGLGSRSTTRAVGAKSAKETIILVRVDADRLRITGQTPLVLALKDATSYSRRTAEGATCNFSVTPLNVPVKVNSDQLLIGYC